jgi:hypothetical protein
MNGFPDWRRSAGLQALDLSSGDSRFGVPSASECATAPYQLIDKNVPAINTGVRRSKYHPARRTARPVFPGIGLIQIRCANTLPESNTYMIERIYRRIIFPYTSTNMV